MSIPGLSVPQGAGATERPTASPRLADSLPPAGDLPRVSAVIPTHNRKDLLRRAVDSILAQTLPCREIIVVSDGSTDGTDEMMREMAAREPRVRFIPCHPPQGGNHARNEGIKAARGDWVAFLDDDDQWHPDKLRKQMELAASDPEIGLVCCGIHSVHADSGRSVLFVPSPRPDSSRLIFLRNCIGSTTTVVVKKSLLERVGMFDESLPALQDYDLWIRICQHAHVAVVREACVEYNNSPLTNQISQSTEKYLQATRKLREKYAAFVAERFPADQSRWEARLDLSVAAKCIRNGQPRLAREYAAKAFSSTWTPRAAMFWLATWFPRGVVNAVKVRVRNWKYRK